MMIDKPYYDYDYKEFEKKQRQEELRPRSDKEMGSILARFGFNTKMGDDADDIQRMAMADANEESN
jgi:hypothetical protein